MRFLARVACVSVLLAGSLLSTTGPTGAGAWTRAKGDGLVIITSGRRVAPMGALTGGPVDRDTNINQIYVEYGLIDGLTVGAKSYLELSTTDLTASSASLGGFIRKRVWQDGKGGVGSVQAGYEHPIESLIGSVFDYADPGAVPDAHVAALYGRGWGGSWGNAFVSTGAAYHRRGEGTADDLRFELTAGYAPWRRFMGMLSFYGLTPLGEGTDASLKIAPSLAYTMWPFVERNEKTPKGKVNPSTIQIGISYDVMNPDDGMGVLVSIWRPF